MATNIDDIFGDTVTSDQPKLKCPACSQMVDHDRGYLVTHSRGKQRGELITSDVVCEFSNKKPDVPLKTILFTGRCPNCGTEADIKASEEYPGSLKKEGGFIDFACLACSVREGHYCKHCNAPIKQTDGLSWITTRDSNGTCEDPNAAGGLHAPIWKDEKIVTFLLTDNHVIDEFQED